LEVAYSPDLLKGRNPYSLNPYYWTGSAWSNAGIVVTERNSAANKIVFTVNSVVGELSFFARPGAMLYLPHMQKAAGARGLYTPSE
jgi:hypothetical protein